MSVPFVCTHCICDQRQEKFCLPLSVLTGHRTQTVRCIFIRGFGATQKVDFLPISILVWLLGVGALVQLRGVVQQRDHATNGRGAANCGCSSCNSLLLQTLRRLPFVTPWFLSGPKKDQKGRKGEILVIWKWPALFLDTFLKTAEKGLLGSCAYSSFAGLCFRLCLMFYRHSPAFLSCHCH